MKNTVYKEFAAKKLKKLNNIQNRFLEKYNVNSFSKWFYESEYSILRLYNDDEDEIFFRYIPIGTFCQKSETWMWSWQNESSIEKNKNETLKIKNLGIENNYKKLFEGTFESDIYDGWEFLAIA